MNANPATGSRLRATRHAVAVPLVNLVALVAVLLGLTTGGVAVGVSAVGVVVWLVVRLALRGPTALA